MFLTVFKLVNNGFSFQNGSWLDWVGSQVCVGDRFGNLFDNRSRGSNNGSRGGNHGGVINHGSGSWSCYIGSSHIGSSDIRSNYRYGSSLLFNLKKFFVMNQLTLKSVKYRQKMEEKKFNHAI